MTDTDTIQEALPADCEIGQDYTILRVLGQGGFGITYLAQDNSMGSQVVIKENLPTQLAGRDADTLTIRPRRGEQENYEWARTRFLDEARLLYKLNHPNIVRVTRAFSALNTAYYVMPWVGGTELGQAVKAREDGTSEAYLTALLRQILGALQYLHENNLLHRDIKPENILIAETGEPVLIDFGAARAMVSERSQTMLESPGYTPFEQVQSHGNIGPWTDIYSLGATLYRLITGERPPRSSDRMGEEDPYIPLTARPELNKRYSAAFLQGFDKALALWPKSRWQSAREWALTLTAAAGATPSPSIPQRTDEKVCTAQDVAHSEAISFRQIAYAFMFILALGSLCFILRENEMIRNSLFGGLIMGTWSLAKILVQYGKQLTKRKKVPPSRKKKAGPIRLALFFLSFLLLGGSCTTIFSGVRMTERMSSLVILLVIVSCVMFVITIPKDIGRK